MWCKAKFRMNSMQLTSYTRLGIKQLEPFFWDKAHAHFSRFNGSYTPWEVDLIPYFSIFIDSCGASWTNPYYDRSKLLHCGRKEIVFSNLLFSVLYKKQYRGIRVCNLLTQYDPCMCYREKFNKFITNYINDHSYYSWLSVRHGNTVHHNQKQNGWNNGSEQNPEGYPDRNIYARTELSCLIILCLLSKFRQLSFSASWNITLHSSGVFVSNLTMHRNLAHRDDV